VRLDSSKANLASPTEKTQWFEKVSVKLPNGDGVGTLIPVSLCAKDGGGGLNDEIRDYVVMVVDRAGGEVGVNAVAQEIEDAGFSSLKRPALVKRVKDVFGKPYICENYSYRLIHGNLGVRKGFQVVRGSAEEL
jgi:hypothetical protein